MKHWFLLAVLMLAVLFAPKTVSAAEAGGEYDDITWQYDGTTKTLTIGGSGAITATEMEDGSYGYPWQSLIDNGEVEIVEVEEGITNLAGVSFYGVKEARLPKSYMEGSFSVYRLEDYFNDSLEELAFPDTEYYGCEDGAVCYIADYGNTLEYVPAGRTRVLTVAADISSCGYYLQLNADKLEGIRFEGNFFYGIAEKITKTSDDTVFTLQYQTGNPTWANAASEFKSLIDAHPDTFRLATYDPYGDGSIRGTLNSKISWVYKDGKLTISGTGAIPATESSYTPAYKRFPISQLVIGEGITKIGDNFLPYCAPYESNSFGKPAKITFPSTLTSIGVHALPQFTGTSLTLPAKLKTIGDRNFYDCSALKTLTIPDSVTSIGNSCFTGTPKMTKVTIGSGLKTLHPYAFATRHDNSGIKKFVVSEDNAYFSSDSKGALLNKKQTKLLLVPSQMTGTYTVPSTVTTMEERTFWGSNLTTVNLGAKVKTMVEYQFGTAEKLEAINVDAANPYYSSVDGVLYNKEQTELIKYPMLKADTSYTVGSKTTSIAYAAFFQVNSLNSVTVPSSVKSIGNLAFLGAENLTKISLAEGLTTIGNSALGATGIKTLVIPSTVTDLRSGLVGEAKLYFRGNVPTSMSLFLVSGKTVYYPKNDTTWTAFKAQCEENYITATWKTWTPPTYLKASMITLSKTSMTYTGKVLKPTVTVKVGTKKLTVDTHYTVSFKNNVNVGTATVTVKGTGSPTKSGSYIGSAKKTFKITKATQPMTVTAVKKTVKASALKTAKVTVTALTVEKAKGTVTYAKVSGSSKLTVNKTTGKITVAKGTKAGTYKIKVEVTAKGNSNYKRGKKTVTVTIIVK